MKSYNECLLCEDPIDPTTAKSDGVRIFIGLWAVFGMALALLAIGVI